MIVRLSAFFILASVTSCAVNQTYTPPVDQRVNATTSPAVSPSTVATLRVSPTDELERKYLQSGLVHCASEGDVDGVRSQIRAGALVDVPDNFGLPAMHAAARHNHRDVIGVLLAAGANPNLRTLGGQTPLHFAANGGVESVRLLLANGARPLATDDEHLTALHWSRNAAVAAAIIEVTGNRMERDKVGRTPLHTAAARDDPKLIETLVEAGADVASQSSNGSTALHFVRDSRVAAALINAGANLEANDLRGRTPIYEVAKNFDPSALNVLIQSGAKVNVRDNSGMTPLHVIVAAGWYRPSVILVNAGADKRAKDSEGRSPIDVAQSLGGQHHMVKSKLIELLK